MLAKYLPDGPYRFSMAFERGNFADFYKPTSTDSSILRERRKWLAKDAAKYLQVLPGAEQLLTEAASQAVAEGTVPRGALETTTAMEQARFLGENWEPDYLILRREGNATRLVCGCVCFPSSWALEEKMSHPIEEIHGVVPSLNAEIGRQIGIFLERIKPGAAWLRSNWGLSRSAELNQHPNRKTLRLDETVALDEVFFRVEEQALTALPLNDGILFGIRLKIISLRDFAGSAEGIRLAEALETMPEAIAQYKGLSAARNRISQLLRG